MQETEAQRTELSASSDVDVEREPSMDPHDNFNTVTRIPQNSEVHFVKPERASPAPSCRFKRSDASMGQPCNGVMSMKSDWSMDHPFNFKRDLTTPDSGVSPAPSCLSMSSDRSMGLIGNFKRELTTPDSGAGASPAPSGLSMSSDRSRGLIGNFKRELTTPDLGVGASPAPSCLSMKSDRSKGLIGNFKRELTTPDLGLGVSPAPSCLSMSSDRSMGRFINFRESVIEFSSILLSSACVRCSLCSSILTNPVSIPCGHSYCNHCINTYWSQLGPTGDYACPQCKTSYPTRPVLSVNLALDWTLQALQETSFSPACPTLPQAGPGDVACDICSGLKLRAVKTCVTCSASYCESHVRQHYTDPALQKHTLVQVNEDTKLSQWGRNSGKMEVIKEEPFMDSESEEHQEVESKRMKMEVEKEETFQHDSLEQSDLKNVSTHLRPLQEKGDNPMGGGGASPQSQQASLLQDTRMHDNVNSQGSILLSSVCFRCSLCSSILTNPVSIHCGHSYCKDCINTHWSQLGPTGEYACPQCKINYPTRPVLSVNLALDWTLQALQETSPALQEKGDNPMGGGGASPQSQQASLLQDTRMHDNVNSQGLMNDGVGSMPTGDRPSTPGRRKRWHEDITQDLRNQLVDIIVQAILPTTDPADLEDIRMEKLVAYARLLEGDMYESANSTDEYYLTTEKIYEIRAQLDEIRRARRQKQGLELQAPPRMGQPPTEQPPSSIKNPPQECNATPTPSEMNATKSALANMKRKASAEPEGEGTASKLNGEGQQWLPPPTDGLKMPPVPPTSFTSPPSTISPHSCTTPPEASQNHPPPPPMAALILAADNAGEHSSPKDANQVHSTTRRSSNIAP